jgi:hypothetical protein
MSQQEVDILAEITAKAKALFSDLMDRVSDSSEAAE